LRPDLPRAGALRAVRPDGARAQRARRVGNAAIGALAAWLLAACAGAPPTAIAPVRVHAYVDTPFVADGRLSARHGNDAVTVRFAWTHRPPRDELTVTSPLGQTVAEMSGDSAAGSVEVDTANGEHWDAADWTALTERALGFPLPVSGLAAWIRGAPHPGTPFTLEADAQGRISVLRQDGWEVVYDYRDAAASAPQRLRITYPDFEIRVVIDSWR
jgi:outer membrane lipoprotein LolB